MRKLLLLNSMIVLAAALLAQEPAPQPIEQGTSSHGQPAGGDEFSDRVVNDVLRQFKDGIEGHNEQRLLSVFDSDQMQGYLDVRDQVGAFLRRYDTIRLHYRIIQADADGPKGVAFVEIQMEAEPRDVNGNPLRRDQQIRFDLTRSEKNWKVTDFSPRDIFAP